MLKMLRSVAFMIATGLLYLGVPLLGWGLRDLEGYFSILPRRGYAVVVLLFSLAVGVQAFSSTEGIRDEEIAMHNEFGTEWETYCQHS